MNVRISGMSVADSDSMVLVKSPAAHRASSDTSVVVISGVSLVLEDDPGRGSRGGMNRGLRGLAGLWSGSEWRSEWWRASVGRLRYGSVEVGKGCVGDGARCERP
jgi:hypothetical protein